MPALLAFCYHFLIPHPPLFAVRLLLHSSHITTLNRVSLRNIVQRIPPDVASSNYPSNFAITQYTHTAIFGHFPEPPTLEIRMTIHPVPRG